MKLKRRRFANTCKESERSIAQPVYVPPAGRKLAVTIDAKSAEQRTTYQGDKKMSDKEMWDRKSDEISAEQLDSYSYDDTFWEEAKEFNLFINTKSESLNNAIRNKDKLKFFAEVKYISRESLRISDEKHEHTTIEKFKKELIKALIKEITDEYRNILKGPKWKPIHTTPYNRKCIFLDIRGNTKVAVKRDDTNGGGWGADLYRGVQIDGSDFILWSEWAK